MSGTWLISYGMLWVLLILNFVLAHAITVLLVRVRSRWHNDARSFAIPFTGKDWLPEGPVYVDLAAGVSTVQRGESGTTPGIREAAAEPASSNGRGAVEAVPSPAVVNEAVSRLLPEAAPPPAPRLVPLPTLRTLPPTPASTRSQRLDSVSVIIPTRDSPSLLGPCLRGLRHAQGQLRLQIICVFSDAPTMSREICERYGAEIVRAKGKFAFAKSVNLGLSHAKEPVILLLNNDVFWQGHGDLQRLVERLQANPQLGLLGPVSDNIGSEGQLREAADPNGQLVHPGYSLIGHCVLFRREVLDAVGNFDESYTTYGYEEVDWFWRARLQGYRWAADETVWVHHEGSATFTKEAIAEGMSTNRQKFNAKWKQDPFAPGAWDWPAPLVSIVMSAHNCEPWLDRCFASILGAGLNDYEVICVDDGSTDNTIGVIQHWSKLLPLKYARFPKADNVARTKNRALRMASGKYIALMDADDEMPQERIPFLLGAIEDSGADLVYGAFELRPDRNADYVPAKIVQADEWELEAYATTETNWVCPCATLFHRKILDDGQIFDESMPAFEDYEWILSIGVRGYRIKEAPGPSCHTYHRRSSTTLESYTWEPLRDGIRQKYGLPTGVIRPESVR